MKSIRFATKMDCEKIHDFLGQAKMEDDKINELCEQFLLLEEDGKIQAVVGYEQAGKDALIRSCLFTPAVDNITFLHFFQTFLQYTKEKSIRQLYLLTNHPQSLTIFQFFQFSPVDKEQVSEGVRQLEHFCKNVKQSNVIILNCQLLTKLSTD